MIATGLAYILMILLAPVFGGIAQLLLLPLSAPIDSQFARFVEGLVTGGAMAWVASLLFHLFGVTFGWLALGVLLLSTLLSDLPRVAAGLSRFGAYCDSVGAANAVEHRQVATTDEIGRSLYRSGWMEIAWMVGDVLGLMGVGTQLV